MQELFRTHIAEYCQGSMTGRLAPYRKAFIIEMDVMGRRRSYLANAAILYNKAKVFPL